MPQVGPPLSFRRRVLPGTVAPTTANAWNPLSWSGRETGTGDEPSSVAAMPLARPQTRSDLEYGEDDEPRQ